MKRVVILNLSDSRGGAAVVSRRLMHALCDAGVDARMLVAHKGTDDPRVILAAPAWRYKIPFLEEAADIYLHNGRCRADIFKVSTARYGLPLSRHPLVAQADAVILAWVNQGFCNFADIRRMARAGKRLIWIMHDMWNLTGICHHAGDCRAYERPEGCSHCPMLHSSAGPHDLSARTWAAKAKLYARAGIRFVAVSSWLAERCRRSALFAGQELHTIGNAFPVDEFYTERRHSRASLGLPPEGKIILMGAARLDDPVKGLPYAVEALNLLADKLSPRTSASERNNNTTPINQENGNGEKNEAQSGANVEEEKNNLRNGNNGDGEKNILRDRDNGINKTNGWRSGDNVEEEKNDLRNGDNSNGEKNSLNNGGNSVDKKNDWIRGEGVKKGLRSGDDGDGERNGLNNGDNSVEKKNDWRRGDGEKNGLRSGEKEDSDMKVTAVFFGDLRDAHALDALRLPHIHLGTVSGDTARELYAHADIVLSTSLYETLPGTLIEGQAAGAIPVSFDRGGQRDIIRSDAEGRLVPFGDTTALATALASTLTTPADKKALRAAATRFSSPTITSHLLPLL